jgi:hypothetical protein
VALDVVEGGRLSRSALVVGDLYVGRLLPRWSPINYGNVHQVIAASIAIEEAGHKGLGSVVAERVIGTLSCKFEYPISCQKQPRGVLSRLQVRGVLLTCLAFTLISLVT